MYATCVKEQCQEMQKEVLRVASEGRIADCFVLLEGAGGCSGNASAQVAGLSKLNRNFDVGDLCGPLCRSTHCAVKDLATSTSISQAAVETTRAGEGSTSIMLMPVNTQRVWKATLSFRVSPLGAFEASLSVVKALRDAIAAALHVSPARVEILDISIPLADEDEAEVPASNRASGKEDDGTAKAGHRRVSGSAPPRLLRRRLPGRETSSSKVEVPFEILDAPLYVDEDRARRPATLTRLQAHLSKLLSWAGFVGTTSSIVLEEFSVELRTFVATGRPTPVEVARSPNITVHLEQIGMPGESRSNRHSKVQFGLFAFALVGLIF